MADEEKYSLISVNSDEEEEIVIQAGLIQEPVNIGASEEAFSQEEAQTSKPVKKALRTENVYQGTTLEDLKATGPLPKTRVIVIASAMVLIVGFIIYYIFIR